MRNKIRAWVIVLTMVAGCGTKKDNAVVIQTDFGTKDGAVAAMKGVAFGVDASLPVYDLTHEIPAYNIWQAAYRLEQTLPYWPAGTVFVSVVDPGVGTARKSIVAKTRSGHYVITPDNGTLTLVARSQGLESIREIDEQTNRRPGSASSYTFHGRDVYVFTAARLAAGIIRFEEVGPEFTGEPVRIAFQEAVTRGDSIYGNIPVLDVQYGNVWTNIPDSLLMRAGIRRGDSLEVSIFHGDSLQCRITAPLVNSFGDVAEKKPLAYFNSLMQFSIALNMADFAATYGVQSGPDWRISLRKAR